jgi:ribose transport system substrate-binding protein
MKTKRRIQLALVLSAGALMAAGTSAFADDKPITLAFLAGIIGDPFYTSMECGARAAAKEFNVDMSWTGPTAWDIAQQQPFVDAAIQTHPDGIVLAPTDSKALIATVQSLMADGTPVVTVDAPMDEPVDLQSIQSNHYLGGGAASDAMGKVTDGEGIYLVLGLHPGLPDIDARVMGFTDAFPKAHPNAKILPVGYPETSSTKAAELVSAAIQANPDLKGVYATHYAAAVGAASAILEAGKKGEIKLISFDAAPEQVRDLKDGVYDALIVQEPYLMGYDSVKLVAGVVRKTVDKASIKHDNLLPFTIATRDNLSDPEVSKYLYVDKCP